MTEAGHGNNGNHHWSLETCLGLGFTVQKQVHVHIPQLIRQVNLEQLTSSLHSTDSSTAKCFQL